MGSCYSCNACNCFSSHRKTLYQKQQEIQQLVDQNKEVNIEPESEIQQIDNNCDVSDHNAEENDKFSLNAIRKERDEYDTLKIVSFMHSINHKHTLNSQCIDLIKQYISQTKILLIETDQTMELQSNKLHILHSIIINRGATLTVNPWDGSLKKGGKLLLHCISSLYLHKSAKICLNSCGYKGGHCSYISAEDEEQFLDSIHDESDTDCDEQTHLREDGVYASYSGESYKGLGLPNCKRNNYGGGGAGSIWGSGGAAGYGTVGFKGQFDKQYSHKSCGKGGNMYGTHLLRPLHLGSGGGAAYGGYDGGDGGGALKIICKNLKMDKCSVMRCNGGDGVQQYLSGAGSGGSIYLVVQDGECVQLHKEARIECIGGEKKELYGYGYKSLNVNNCGKGGYGRIRIQCGVNGDKLKKKFKNEWKYCIEPVPYIG